MRFLFKYASRGRPEWFKQTIHKYISMLSNEHEYFWIISCDQDDPSMNNDSIKKYIKHNIPNHFLYYEQNKSKIEAINANMEGVNSFDVLFVVSDDMTPWVQGFDSIIARDMLRYFPELDGALHYHDGCCGKDQTITLSIMGRKLYEYFGYIYHPSYKSFYCDNEFTDVVRNLGKYKYINETIVKHEYKGFKKEADAIYKMNSAKGVSDAHTYHTRKNIGFVPLKLSVLICTINGREPLLERLLLLLNKQKTNEVEILVEKDNKQITTGQKRNILLNRAQGEYCCFIDDDDLVSSDYISQILCAIKTKPDCVGLEGEITFKRKKLTKKFIHTIQCKSWCEKDGVYYRSPNHLNPIKTKIAQQVRFIDVSVSEDHDFSKRIQPLLKTEVFTVNKPIYFYLTG